LWPLVSRIVRTVIVVSLKPLAPLNERGLYSPEFSINSSAPVSLRAHWEGTASRSTYAGPRPCRIKTG
jgi:hypothetical protein